MITPGLSPHDRPGVPGPGAPRARLPRRRHGRLSLTVSLAAAAALGACGSGGTAGGTADASSTTRQTTGSTSSTAALSGTVTVLAAASLTESFTAVAKTFEQANPAVTVRLSFGSSSTLAQQIAQGADADLFASAGEKALQLLPEKDRAPEATRTLATNSLAIATPPSNPGKVTGLTSLANPNVDVVLCAATVPCGSAADTVLGKAGVTAHVVSREIDVKATLAKVSLGEADAAIVYVSDVTSAGAKVHGVQIPAAQNTTLKYPLVLLTSTPAAKAFADALSGAEGRRALTAAGFAAP